MVGIFLMPLSRRRSASSLELFPGFGVVAFPAKKAVVFSIEVGSNVAGHQRSFNEESSRATHGVKELTRLHQFWPFGAPEHGGGKRLFQRRKASFNAVAAAVQAAAGQVDTESHLVLDEACVDGNVGLFKLNRRTLAGFVANLVDDGIFDFQRGKMAVVDLGLSNHAVNRHGLKGIHVVEPVDVFGRIVKFFAIGGGEGAQAATPGWPVVTINMPGKRPRGCLQIERSLRFV